MATIRLRNSADFPTRNALQWVHGPGANYDVFVARIEVPEPNTALLAIAAIALPPLRLRSIPQPSRITAGEALQIRLVHEVHSVGAIDAAIARVVGDILNCAPGALAATKHLMAKARWERPAAMVHEAALAFSLCLIARSARRSATSARRTSHASSRRASSPRRSTSERTSASAAAAAKASERNRVS